jgi:hypothetical protein
VLLGGSGNEPLFGGGWDSGVKADAVTGVDTVDCVGTSGVDEGVEEGGLEFGKSTQATVTK